MKETAFSASLFLFMRLDVFLKLSRIIIRRTLAKEFTKKGLIQVNGITAKASHAVKVGDEIEIRKHDNIKTIRVLSVPQKKQLSKKDSKLLFELLSDINLEREF